MLICKWEKLPSFMQTDEVRPYWEKLRKRNWNLFWKRVFDIFLSFIMLVLLCPLFIVLAIVIKIDSRGPVFYRQVRYTQYGKKFRIHKFRSMVLNAEQSGLLTSRDDERITRVGRFIRKCKLDELGQIIDVFIGKMTFVGTRPEVEKYVNAYNSKMVATLLLPAGVTSVASFLFKDENDLLNAFADKDKAYIEKILPAKMYYNLKELTKEGMFHDIKVMFMTVFAILGKKYEGDYKPGSLE